MFFEVSKDVLNAFLIIVRNHATILTFIALGIFILLKDRLAIRFAAVCAAFYSIGFFSYPLVISLDKETLIYRYIYWAANDVLFMAIIAYWALKDKVYLWQSIIAQLIVLPAPLLQLFRLVDRHLLDLTYSTYLYKTILPLVNIIVVLLCFVPLLVTLKRVSKTKISLS